MKRITLTTIAVTCLLATGFSGAMEIPSEMKQCAVPVAKALAEELNSPISCYRKINYPSLGHFLKRHKEIYSQKEFKKKICKSNINALNCQMVKAISSISAEDMVGLIATNPQIAEQFIQFDNSLESLQRPKDFSYFTLLKIIAIRAQQAKQFKLANPEVETLFTGDSIMAGYEPVGKLHHSKAFFSGIPGDRSDMLISRLFWEVRTLQPTNVVLSISGNDILQNCAEDRIQNNRILIVNALKCMGVKNVYWMALPPISLNGLAPTVVRNNQKLKDLEGVNFVDSYSKMVDAKGEILEQYRGDGIHFRALGYEEVWVPMLKALGL